MANTYTQLDIHVVFAVKYRAALIDPSWEATLFKYITGIVQGKGQKMLAIGGMPDHIHFLVGMEPDCCISDLVREVKKASTEFVNENAFAPSKFQWQGGFGAFSCSKSHRDRVIPYILNQREHHKKRSFKSEFYALLRRYEIEFKDEYLFEWLLE